VIASASAVGKSEPAGDRPGGDGRRRAAGHDRRVTDSAQTARVVPVEAADALLCDLDGVVYVGPDPVPAAGEAVARARELGVAVLFLTNNASRTAEQTAELLSGMGVPATAVDVVTSAQVAAHVAAEQFGAGARALVLGTDALRSDVRDAGLTVVRTADDDPAVVVQGLSRELTYGELAEAVLAIHRGAGWVASNRDTTLPDARGPLPGNGALVAAVAAATGAVPVVPGKPGPAMYLEAADRSSSQHPLAVGDRVDTDIDGAIAAGIPSLLVMTGVTDLLRLATIEAGHRPTYVATDIGGVLRPLLALDADGPVDGWRVQVSDGDLVLDGEGDPDDGLWLIASTGWSELDAGRPVTAIHAPALDPRG
jgi:glycerol 3-phosphatase-2